MPKHTDLDFVIYTTPDGEIREWRYPATNDWTREQGVFGLKRGCYRRSPFWGLCDLYGGHEGKHSNVENRTARHEYGYAPSRHQPEKDWDTYRDRRGV